MVDTTNSKGHDFDQRHDGPFDPPTQPAVEMQPVTLSKTQTHSHSAPQVPTLETSSINEKNADQSSPPVASPVGKTRKSVQLPRDTPQADESGLPRRSAQMSRGRPSRDFDVRRDGPYGRPSMTMVRRQSSAPVDATALDPEEGPVAPTLDELERGVAEGGETRPFFEPTPPSLNYSLWPRKWHIAWFWSLILIDCIAMPLVLYFCLNYLTNLSDNAVFSIVTAALGGVSIFEYFIRFWRLWKKNSTCRVIGARRAYLDWFHWNFSLGWVIIMVELIVGTIPKHPPIRLLAMPVASMLYAFGTELLIVDALRFFKVPAPCRMSSIPKGAQLRPAIYSIIEDVVAVDGSGGTEFREALNRRYEASHTFRAMLRRLGVFWAFGAEGMAVVTTIIVFTIDGDPAYVVGWSAPFVWAGIWTAATFWYVNICLKRESTTWAEELAEKQAALGAGSEADGSQPGTGRESEGTGS